MSVNLAPDDVPVKMTGRSLAAMARAAAESGVDPRVRALVPGFDGPFFQAGLAGYSDAPMRLVARHHGCPYCVTEALLDRTLINGGKGRRREDPDLLKEECGTGEIADNIATSLVLDGQQLDDHPIAGQIMGTTPDEMAEGAAILAGMGYDTIDVNLACPVKKIRRRARGGHFLNVPEQAIDVLGAVRAAVPKQIPCTVKIRRAFDESSEASRNFERIFTAIYDLGYAWATVHCRTVEQKYKGPGRWPFLTDLVQRYGDRVIFGSGDVWTVGDIFAMLELTGVSAVSVARGCIGNPWMFRQARDLMAGADEAVALATPPLDEQRRALMMHFALSVQLHGEAAASRMMRKFGIKFSIHHPTPDVVRSAFITCRSVEDWRAVLDEHYAKKTSRNRGVRQRAVG